MFLKFDCPLNAISIFLVQLVSVASSVVMAYSFCTTSSTLWLLVFETLSIDVSACNSASTVAFSWEGAALFFVDTNGSVMSDVVSVLGFF